MPPNLLTMGTVPFGDSQRTRLSAWLNEAAWPRGHMEMAELEGYLVALISWPVGYLLRSMAAAHLGRARLEGAHKNFIAAAI